MKYYKVIISGGHVGAGHSIPLTFYIKAKDMLSAIKKARSMPGVKHDKVRALASATEITAEEYNENIKNYSAYDIYNNR